jgi:hypothetical protein
MREEFAVDERLKQWRPTPEEVDRIRIELRPLIREMARRDSEALREVEQELFFRRLSKVG